METKHPVDVHVGSMIRQRRLLVGMSQQGLARIVGIRFQQIQKYETGTNRVSASRLWEIARALDVPIAFFFEGISQTPPVGFDAGIPADFTSDKRALDLVRTYYSIPEASRRRLNAFARDLRRAI